LCQAIFQIFFNIFQFICHFVAFEMSKQVASAPTQIHGAVPSEFRQKHPNPFAERPLLYRYFVSLATVLKQEVLFFENIVATETSCA